MKRFRKIAVYSLFLGVSVLLVGFLAAPTALREIGAVLIRVKTT